MGRGYSPIEKLPIAEMMQEWAILLWAMTASHYEWPIPASPVAVELRGVESRTGPPELPPALRAELKKALERTVRCATGRMTPYPASQLHIPEQKHDCE